MQIMIYYAHRVKSTRDMNFPRETPLQEEAGKTQKIKYEEEENELDVVSYGIFCLKEEED